MVKIENYKDIEGLQDSNLILVKQTGIDFENPAIRGIVFFEANNKEYKYFNKQGFVFSSKSIFNLLDEVKLKYDNRGIVVDFYKPI